MRDFPTPIRDALDSGVTHFCYCWQITRTDNTRLGLTDHDQDLQFDGLTFHADSGISVTTLESRLGLAPHGPEITGGLTSRHLRHEDLQSGRYDDAAYTLWLVDWREPQNRIALLSGHFGAVQYKDNRFQVSLRAKGQKLNQPQGRIYQSACSADLGDAQCRFNVAREPYQISAQVISIEGHTITLPALASERDWFRGGHIITAANRRLVIREDKISDDNQNRIIILWETATPHIATGDTITLQTGCDKHYKTCLRKFNNAINFQGFPTLAEESVLLRVGG